MAIVNYQLFCVTENQNVNWLLDNTAPPPHTCPNNSAHTINPNSIVLIGNTSAPSLNSSDDVVVQTQFERTDITLKTARMKVTIANNYGVAKLLVPGTFGGTEGRLVAGGYGVLNSYDPEDFLLVYVEDTNRAICAAMGLATDGSADAIVQGMGVLPGGLAAFGALPSYPIIQTYYDTEVPTANQGWYLWPLAQGNNLPPFGECEFEPLGYYGNIPAGLFLCVSITRPNVATGTFNADVEWGVED